MYHIVTLPEIFKKLDEIEQSLIISQIGVDDVPKLYQNSLWPALDSNLIGGIFFITHEAKFP